jgi:hypothetical protein
MTVDYVGLCGFLKSLSYKDFKEGVKILEGNSMSDIEFFKVDISKQNKESVIDYGMPFLVDAVGNDLSVCVHTKRRYRVDGRLVQMKFDRVVIRDCQKQYGSPLNGYWIIPKKFISLKESDQT